MSKCTSKCTSKFNSGLIVIMFCFFFIITTAIKRRLEALEQAPNLELTCSIKDNQGRYVCRYVEVVK